MYTLFPYTSLFRSHLGEARPDYEYGYDSALADRRVVRPVWFPRINGFMEWTATDGTATAASFDDALDRQRSAQRLRTALRLDGEWLPTVLAQANDRAIELQNGRANIRTPSHNEHN